MTDMTAAEPQEFKDDLVYGEQAGARTLGELVLQKKKTIYSDLFLFPHHSRYKTYTEQL